MTAKLPRQQAETFQLQERIGEQMTEIAALKKALRQLIADLEGQRVITGLNQKGEDWLSLAYDALKEKKPQ